MQRVGWIGTGIMGRSMVEHVLSAGYPVTVHNRTKDKARSAIGNGAVWVDSPGAVAKGSDIVFTIIGTPADVENVYFGPDGILENISSGGIVVDMTTSKPSLARRIAETAEQKGCEALDAPVSGGDVGARDGNLAIMVGGERKSFEAVLPLFEIMGKNIGLLGGPGAGQHTKACNQILVASNFVGVVESLLYGHRAGLDLNDLIDIVGKGAAASFALDTFGPRIAKGDFAPGFMIKHFVKDLGIVLSEARAMNLSLPGLAMANQFYLAAMAQGLEDSGIQALYTVLAQMNNV